MNITTPPTLRRMPSPALPIAIQLDALDEHLEVLGDACEARQEVAAHIFENRVSPEEWEGEADWESQFVEADFLTELVFDSISKRASELRAASGAESALAERAGMIESYASALSSAWGLQRIYGLGTGMIHFNAFVA